MPSSQPKPPLPPSEEHLQRVADRAAAAQDWRASRHSERVLTRLSSNLPESQIAAYHAVEQAAASHDDDVVQALLWLLADVVLFSPGLAYTEFVGYVLENIEGEGEQAEALAEEGRRFYKVVLEGLMVPPTPLNSSASSEAFDGGEEVFTITRLNPLLARYSPFSPPSPVESKEEEEEAVPLIHPVVFRERVSPAQPFVLSRLRGFRQIICPASFLLPTQLLDIHYGQSYADRSIWSELEFSGHPLLYERGIPEGFEETGVQAMHILRNATKRLDVEFWTLVEAFVGREGNFYKKYGGDRKVMKTENGLIGSFDFRGNFNRYKVAYRPLFNDAAFERGVSIPCEVMWFDQKLAATANKHNYPTTIILTNHSAASFPEAENNLTDPDLLMFHYSLCSIVNGKGGEGARAEIGRRLEEHEEQETMREQEIFEDEVWGGEESGPFPSTLRAKLAWLREGRRLVSGKHRSIERWRKATEQVSYE
ncbi:hypothetical protein P7C70_g9037, partial [Phenoliferia sp. Uapishka_3]